MYLPQSKYNIKHTIGGELIKPDVSYHVGSYVETYTGELFTGQTITKDSVPLLNTSEEDFDEEFVSFTNDHIQPTEIDYQRGFFKRYFLKDKRNRQIIEVKQKKFFYYYSKIYTIPLSLDWILVGQKNDINRGVYIDFGISTFNNESVLEGEEKIKGLSKILNNPLEFVR